MAQTGRPCGASGPANRLVGQGPDKPWTAPAEMHSIEASNHGLIQTTGAFGAAMPSSPA